MSNSAKITLVDYECGNLKSVEQAFAHCGADVEITSDVSTISKAEKLVLPGVGAFPVGMENLEKLGLVEVITERAKSGVPLLGICLGMQLLFEHSEEHGSTNGLGLIKGVVDKIESSNPELKLPHIGWNKLFISKKDFLLTESDYFYFVHTYMAKPAEKSSILALSQYEDVEFCAAVNDENIWGMQFHPENSSKQGLEILSRFILL